MIAIELIVGLTTLILLDIVLSFDNAILISMATKDLSDRDRRTASAFGAFGAVLMRLVFIIVVIVFFELLGDIPVVYMLGGLLLLIIGWGLTKPSTGEKKVSSSGLVLKAALTIIVADIMMSFDNALVIGDIVLGFDFGVEPNVEVAINIFLIVLALMISLAVILFASKHISKFMEKNKWIIYVAAWLLFSVAFEMLFKDAIFTQYVFKGDFWEAHEWLVMLIAYWAGAIVTVFNWFLRDFQEQKNKKPSL